MKNIKLTLDKIMQEEINRGDAVGTVCLVFKDNREIYRGCFGTDNLTDGKPMLDTNIFRMYSMSKPVTSLAVMIAIERGLIKLTDEAEHFLPGFKNMNILQSDGSIKPANNHITVKHLLSMTAGLEYPNDFTAAGRYLGENLFWPIEQNYPDKTITTVELMNRVGECPLIYEPGTKWNYSLCADVLGAIIEIASGISYGEFMHKNIFEPLGMMDTGFYVPDEKSGRLVTMHDKNDGKYVPWDSPFLGMMSPKYKPVFESGGAGLVSTPDDYAKFALTLLNDGCLPGEYAPDHKPVRIISKETAEFMRTPVLDESQRETANWEALKGYNYGNLMKVLEDADQAGLRGTAPGEFGWDGWAGTYVSVDPANRIVFMYFINVTNGNREYQMRVLKNALYECLDLA